MALHHLDAPWKRAEVAQRDGRILRLCNDNKELAIYRTFRRTFQTPRIRTASIHGWLVEELGVCLFERSLIEHRHVPSGGAGHRQPEFHKGFLSW
jgi:hypothetical protein